MGTSRLWGRVLVISVVLFGLMTPAMGFDQPLINLGFTSFVDGGPPSGPGHYFQQYFQFIHAYKLPNHPASSADVDIFGSLSQYVYQSDQPILFGGKWGIDVIQPVGTIDSTDPSGAVTDSGGSFGDLLVGPFLQWDPIMGDNGPVFMHRIELQTVWPTGGYDRNKGLNVASNFFSFNPYWAGTYFITPEWTATCRLHYLWNDKNDDPFVGFGANDTQAGEVFHMNFASSYELEPKKLRVGVNGYYLKQISDSKRNGVSQTGREQVFGIGPGALYSMSSETHMFFNAYFESHVRYRGQGSRYTFRLVHHFN
ncbi:MAG: phenol degradation protein meta [Planctomycetes bacterium]|nr:phenol degradation protein meta [Planctomycetota bacterium]